MSEVRLSIVIINYNLEEEITKCINSIMENVKSSDFEIIVIDNGSANKYDGELIKHNERIPVRIIRSDVNLGFGQGCNLGVANALGKYLCFLNPDVIVNENVFEKVIRVLNATPNSIIGIRTNVIKNIFDMSAGYFPKISYELINILMAGRYLEAYIIYKKAKKSESILEVDWVIGASIFIDKTEFERLGKFNSDYFIYFEEMDLCFKAKKSGMKVLYLPETSIEHLGSVSTKKNYEFFTYNFYKSKLIFYRNNYHNNCFYLFRLVTLIQCFVHIAIWSILSLKKQDVGYQKIKGYLRIIKMIFKSKEQW